MAKRTAVGGDNDGYISGRTFFRGVSPYDRVVQHARCLRDDLLDRLVDEGVEYVVLMDDDVRLASALTDWQDYGKETEDGWTSLALSYMTRPRST